MMYGGLMKFAVECGRTDLSRTLGDKVPSWDIQAYMPLIRAAGRDKDVNRAFAVLKRLKDTGVSLDIAAHNCVLEVCVSSGDLKRGRSLMEEMQSVGSLDVITYNTLLKGYCVMRDLKGAQSVLDEMEAAGLPPNDVSYNCYINAAVSSGRFQEAWDTVEKMERSNTSKVDHFTISIMMKGLENVKEQNYVQRTFELLDRARIDVFSDEILLNTLLETCVRHRQDQRLSDERTTRGELRGAETFNWGIDDISNHMVYDDWLKSIPSNTVQPYYPDPRGPPREP